MDTKTKYSRPSARRNLGENHSAQCKLPFSASVQKWIDTNVRRDLDEMKATQAQARKVEELPAKANAALAQPEVAAKIAALGFPDELLDAPIYIEGKPKYTLRQWIALNPHNAAGRPFDISSGTPTQDTTSNCVSLATPGMKASVICFRLEDGAAMPTWTGAPESLVQVNTNEAVATLVMVMNEMVQLPEEDNVCKRLEARMGKAAMIQQGLCSGYFK